MKLKKKIGCFKEINGSVGLKENGLKKHCKQRSQEELKIMLWMLILYPLLEVIWNR